MTGKTVSHYRILESLGEGGMGVVYKAEDTRLKRTVALKFLSQGLAGNGEHSDRFLREARAAAALDHPNICTVYEIDEAESRTFLAMAFLEGEPLDKRVERGPLALDLAIEIARQAAEGLTAAHRAGVVHRDVKSSNIMLLEGQDRPVVKLMDFGLAQISGASKLTKVDTRLGTVAYMSPEQALGEGVGPRSDLWSLGVVLYEMVAGELPFQGHYDQAIIYSILHEEPQPLTAQRARLPMELEWIVDKCLAKSPGDRYQDGRELVVDLEMLQRRAASGKTLIQPIDSGAAAIGQSGLERLGPKAPGELSAAEPLPRPVAAAPSVPRAAAESAPTRWFPRWAAGLALAAAAGAFLAGALAGRLGQEETTAPLRRFTLRPIEATQEGKDIGHLAIAPDGRTIAFSTTGSDGSLWLQPLDSHEPSQVDGTRGARDVFWSPDSDFVGFVAGRGLAKVALRGRTLTTLVEDAGLPFGTAAWSADGESIVFAPPGGAPMQVSAFGGAPKPLIGAAPNRRAVIEGPSLLTTPGGDRVLLYSERTLDGDSIMLRRLADESSSEPVRLVEGRSPVYSETGHVLFQPSAMTSALWAIRVSLDALETQGEAFLVAQNASDPSVSADGTLAYLDNADADQKQLFWVDRAGRTVGEIGKEQPWIVGPRISPTGSQVLALGGSGRNFDLWVHDAARPVLNRLSFDDEQETGVVWAPDGRRVAITLRGSPSVEVVTVGGGAPAERLYDSPDGPLSLLDWSRDGRFILFQKRRRPDGGRGGLEGGALPGLPGPKGLGGGFAGQSSIGYLERAGDAWEEREFIPEAPVFLDDAVFSPDGRFVAYESNESGETQLYVRPFPAGVERWQITTEGGRLVRWSPRGDELYYVRDETLYAVPVETRGGFRAAEATPLFTRASLAGVRRFATYDAGPDGRFAVVGPAGEPRQPAIRLVLNWFSEFAGL